MSKAGIIGVGSAVPERVVSNKELIAMTGIESTPEWILENTGIAERRFADLGETNAMYGAKAAQVALERAGLAATDLDLIITATTTPDRGCPSTAVAIQDLIGATNTPAFDLSAGCSGFCYGLNEAAAHIEAGYCDNVLVVGVDLLTKIMNFHDRKTCILLGDGAGAAVVSRIRTSSLGIHAFVQGADGSMLKKLFIPTAEEAAILNAQAKKDEDRTATAGKLYMDGPAVFKFAVKILPQVIEELCASLDVTPDAIDVVVPHQANLRIVEKAQAHFGNQLPLERFFLNLETYGNTSAASIAIALDEWVLSTQEREGKLVILVGFGAGLTWAGTAMTWAY